MVRKNVICTLCSRWLSDLLSDAKNGWMLLLNDVIMTSYTACGFRAPSFLYFFWFDRGVESGRQRSSVQHRVGQCRAATIATTNVVRLSCCSSLVVVLVVGASQRRPFGCHQLDFNPARRLVLSRRRPSGDRPGRVHSHPGPRRPPGQGPQGAVRRPRVVGGRCPGWRLGGRWRQRWSRWRGRVPDGPAARRVHAVRQTEKRGQEGAVGGGGATVLLYQRRLHGGGTRR